MPWPLNLDATIIKRLLRGTELRFRPAVDDFIYPVIDVRDILTQGIQEWVASTATFTTDGQFSGVEANDGEIWLVHYVGCKSDNLDADQNIGLNIAVDATGSGVAEPYCMLDHPSHDEQTGTDFEYVTVGKYFERPLLIRGPGMAIGAFVVKINPGVAGSVPVTTIARITRVST